MNCPHCNATLSATAKLCDQCWARTTTATSDDDRIAIDAGQPAAETQTQKLCGACYAEFGATCPLPFGHKGMHAADGLWWPNGDAKEMCEHGRCGRSGWMVRDSRAVVCTCVVPRPLVPSVEQPPARDVEGAGAIHTRPEAGVHQPGDNCQSRNRLLGWRTENMRTLQITEDLLTAAHGTVGVDIAKADGYLLRSLARAIVASAQPAQGTGLPAVGSPVELWMLGWRLTKVSSVNEQTGEFATESGLSRRIADEGGTWRRVQQAEPAQPSKPDEQCYVSFRSPDGTELGCMLSRQWETGTSVKMSATGQRMEAVAMFRAKTWDEAMQMHYDLHGLGQYKPMDKASSEPAGAVTTESIRSWLDGGADNRTCGRSFTVGAYFDAVKRAEADIRANIARATAADRATIAELRGELADIRNMVDPDGVRTDVTAAWLVEHMFTRLLRQVDVAQTAGRHHNEAREALAVALSLPSSESMNGCIAAAAKLRQAREADAARVELERRKAKR